LVNIIESVVDKDEIAQEQIFSKIKANYNLVIRFLLSTFANVFSL